MPGSTIPATVTFELPVAADADVKAELRRVTELLEDLKSRLPSIDNRVLLDREEAARRLGVSVRTLFDWVKAGIVPSVTIGSITRFRASALEQFARERESLKEGAK